MKRHSNVRQSFLHQLPLLFGLLITLSISSAARADGGLIDQWYIIRMADQRAGWMHFREERLGRIIVTTTKVHIEVARGAAKINIDMDSAFYEQDQDGMPFKMESTQTLGTKPIKRTFEFKDDHITLIVEQNGQSTRSKLDLPAGEWLAPAAARRYVLEQMRIGAKEFSYSMMDPLNGPTPIKVNTTVVGPATIELIGKTVPAMQWSTTQDVSPNVVTTEYVSESGVPLRTELSLGAITLTVLASEKELALAEIEPSEIMVSTLVKPSRSIPYPRRSRTGIYLLSVDEGTIGDLPNTGSQRVERVDDQHVRVHIDATRFTPADPGDLTDSQYRTGPALVDWRDKRVMALAKNALGKVYADTSRPLMAEAMRRYVHNYITDKNLDVGLASATEVCVTKEGDCTEHAVLLAAMLRAMGIPSRVASGLIYAEQFAGRSRIFGYHMWTQALLADAQGTYRWVDLDATLDGGTPYDATHIALNVSSLNDNDMINSMAGFAPLIGRLNIEVETPDPSKARRKQ
jgi:transglutaminase-like putative cysteine protease